MVTCEIKLCFGNRVNVLEITVGAFGIHPFAEKSKDLMSETVD